MTEELEKLTKLLEEKVKEITEKVDEIISCLEDNNLYLKTPIEFLKEDEKEN